MSSTTTLECHPSIHDSLSAKKAVFEPSLTARWVGIEELTSQLDSWTYLSENAVWRSPSLEPNYLIPALRHLSNGQVRVLIVENMNTNAAERLVGLLPFEAKRVYGLPFKAISVWKHEQCFDSTPLLAKTHAEEAWKRICNKLKEEGVELLSLDTVSAEGNVDSIFQNAETSLGLKRFQRDQYQRAAFTPSVNAGSYIQQFVSKSIRKNARRLIRRLEDIGCVTWETSKHDSDYAKLADEFLRIESSGWKGEEGTALDSNGGTRAFYKELIRDSSKVGKARFLSLKLDGIPIAMLSDIQSGDVVYSYKTAYDDKFSKFSPGQQVEVKNLEFLHRDGIRLGDSCTASGNSTINRIWGQKLTFQNVIFSLKPGLAREALKIMPKIQSAVHGIRNIFNK